MKLRNVTNDYVYVEKVNFETDIQEEFVWNGKTALVEVKLL